MILLPQPPRLVGFFMHITTSGKSRSFFGLTAEETMPSKGRLCYGCRRMNLISSLICVSVMYMACMYVHTCNWPSKVMGSASVDLTHYRSEISEKWSTLTGSIHFLAAVF